MTPATPQVFIQQVIRSSDCAALWNSAGTTATPLSLVTGFNISEATGINNSGTIIGQMKKLTSSTDFAVRWDTPGVATLLEHLGPNIPGSTTTNATAISDAGVVAGTSSKHDMSGNLLGTFAVRWAPLGTTATELQNPWTDPTTGRSEAHVTAINAAGTIVGYAERYPGYGPVALRWDPESTDAKILANLGTKSTGAYVSTAFDINAAGYIVGFADKYSPAGLIIGYMRRRLATRRRGYRREFASRSRQWMEAYDCHIDQRYGLDRRLRLLRPRWYRRTASLLAVVFDPHSRAKTRAIARYRRTDDSSGQ